MPESVPTIFVVDDDASMCQAIQRLLSAAGFQTRAFGSAEAVLDAGPLDEAACLVVDINLPGLSGLELASRLEGCGLRRIPVIFITAYDQPAYAVEAQRLNALAYLRKPFAGSQLLTAVRGAASTPATLHETSKNLRSLNEPAPGHLRGSGGKPSAENSRHLT